MERGHVNDYVIRSAVRLVHPMVLRNVFSMAMDEMDKVYDLDSQVCFCAFVFEILNIYFLIVKNVLFFTYFSKFLKPYINKISKIIN
jgi:hypothetical protein